MGELQTRRPSSTSSGTVRSSKVNGKNTTYENKTPKGCDVMLNTLLSSLNLYKAANSCL